jgi:hypothetical protein
MSCVSLPESSPVEVIIRVRPLSQRETNNNVKNIILVDKNKLNLINPEDNKSKDFQYDHIYDRETNQQDIYNNVGKKIIDHAFNGYNCCIFAYGISGSGKTHTIMGYNSDPGLIPRISQSLFEQQIQRNLLNNNMQFKIDISYFEIYSEKIRDLLSSNKSDTIPQIREHPEFGPYVEGLTSININSALLIKKLIEQGNKERTIASTLLNDRSSRSHAILTIIFTQINTLDGTETTSKINIVDLAGSEKISLSGVKGVNLKEAININASLSALGLVISRLAENSNKGMVSDNKNKKIDSHIPFRDSILTWILKESLGGNSKTYMIANVSPASIHYNENLNTLRYARNAKKIINSVHINQDTSERIINMLKDEIKNLKSKIGDAIDSDEIKKLQNILKEREILMKEKEKTWEERIIENQKINEALQLHLRQELEQKQIEFRKNLENMVKENQDLINEINKLRDENKTYQENILSSDKFNEEMFNTKKEFERKQEQFEKERIVEATWKLQEKYDKKIDELRISYEIKIDELRTNHAAKIIQLNKEISSYLIEIEKLNKEIVNNKAELEKVNKELINNNKEIVNNKVELEKVNKELINNNKEIVNNNKELVNNNKKFIDLEIQINELKNILTEQEKQFLIKENNYISQLEQFNNIYNHINKEIINKLDTWDNQINNKIDNQTDDKIDNQTDTNNINSKFIKSYTEGVMNYIENTNLNNNGILVSNELLNNFNNKIKEIFDKEKELITKEKNILDKEKELITKEKNILDKENYILIRQNEIDIRQNEIDIRQNEIDIRQNEIDIKQNENINAELIITIKKNENINKENELSNKEIELLNIKKELLEKANELKLNKQDITLEYNTLNTRYSDLINIHNQYKKDYEIIKENKKLLNEENILLNDKNIQLIKENEDLIQKNKQFDNLQTENDNLIKDNNNLQTDNNNLQTDNNNLQTDNDNLIKNNDKLQTDNNKLQTDNNKLQTDNDNLIKNNDKLQTDNDKLQTDNDNLIKNNDKLQTDNDKLQTDNDKLQTDNDKLQTDNDKLQTDNDKLQTDNDNLIKDNDKLQTDNDNLIKNNAKLQTDNDNLIKNNDKLIKENDKLKNNTDYKDTNNTNLLFQKINDLENDIKHKTDQFNIDRNSLTKQIQQLHGKLNNLNHN